jgi:hypothetical protein
MACELIVGDILESLKRELDRIERHAQGLRGAIAGYEAAIESRPPLPEGSLESRRWRRSNGKPVRPIEAMEELLGEHQGEMPTQELFDLLVSGGAFYGKGNPASAFKLSIHLNMKLDRLIQIDANGKELTAKEVQDLKPPSAIFPGITRLKR